MSHHKKFIHKVKEDLEKLDEEFARLDQQMQEAGFKAKDWSQEQLHLLRADWHKCQAKMEHLSAAGDASLEESKAEAEQHWKALQAAVQTYRDQIKNHAA